MTRKPQPSHTNATNADILAAVKHLNEAVAPIPRLVEDVKDLKEWRHDEELTKRAISEFVKQNPQLGSKPQEKGSEQWLNRELLKTLVYALAIIASLVALLQTGLHK